MPRLTQAQRGALKWLAMHNRDGAVERWGTIVAAGERSPVMRQTWEKLCELGLIEFYQKKKRARLTQVGTALALQIPESEASECLNP